jgi:hypothetical protein
MNLEMQDEEKENIKLIDEHGKKDEISLIKCKIKTPDGEKDCIVMALNYVLDVDNSEMLIKPLAVIVNDDIAKMLIQPTELVQAQS